MLKRKILKILETLTKKMNGIDDIFICSLKKIKKKKKNIHVNIKLL